MRSMLIAIATTLGVCAACAAAVGATQVVLREAARTNGSVVRLADVAEVSGADREQTRRLAALPLIPAPAPGTQRFLRQREIADLLAAHGLGMEELRLSGSDQVLIAAPGDAWRAGKEPNPGDAANAAAQTVNRHAAILAGETAVAAAPKLSAAQAERLLEECRRTIVEHLNTKTDQAASWDISCELDDRHLALIDAATTPPVCHGGTSPWTGRQRFVVAFHTRDGPVQVPITAEVAATSLPVAVAVRPIARGDVVTAAHVELRSIDSIPRVSGRRAPIDDLEKLLGMEARQPISAGEVVFADQLQAPLLVKRGEMISVESNSGAIRVRTAARARQEGALGELVQVESLETRERYDARVIGLRKAEVLALTRRAAEPADRRQAAR